MRVHSSYPLERIEYRSFEGDQLADVWLHDNIEEVESQTEEGATYKEWVADEVHFKTALTKSEIEENFDSLWVKAEYEQRPLEQRITDLEALMDETISLVLGGE